MNEWDEEKRVWTLRERSIDFADADEVFRGRTVNLPDERRDYGEPRWISGGWLRGRFVIVVWTPRGANRRIISMRYGHADEEESYAQQLD